MSRTSDFELVLPPPNEFSIQQGDVIENGNSNSSLDTEFDVRAINKVKQGEINNDSSSGSRWDPENSDFSLEILLPSSQEASSSGDPNNDSAEKKNFMESADSLDLDMRQSADMEEERPEVSENGEDVDENKAPKKVSFFPRVRIKRVPNRVDISMEEAESVWYCRQEYQAFKKECFRTIRLMEEEDILDDEDLCGRGLEYKTSKAYKDRQRRKAYNQTIVFEEQEYQMESGTPDPEWLAQLTADQSQFCAEAAVLMGQRDAEDAKKIYLAT